MAITEERTYQKYHRLNLCIEVPAINQPGGTAEKRFEKAGITRFEDVLQFVGSLMQSKQDAGGVIGNARYRFDIEWNTPPSLTAEIMLSHGINHPANPDDQTRSTE